MVTYCFANNITSSWLKKFCQSQDFVQSHWCKSHEKNIASAFSTCSIITLPPLSLSLPPFLAQERAGDGGPPSSAHSDLNGQLQSLTERLAGLREEEEGIRERVGELKEEEVVIRERVGELKEEEAGIRQRVGELNEEEVVMRERVGELKEEEAGIRQRVDRLRDEENRLKRAREEKERDATAHLNKVRTTHPTQYLDQAI